MSDTASRPHIECGRICAYSYLVPRVGVYSLSPPQSLGNSLEMKDQEPTSLHKAFPTTKGATTRYRVLALCFFANQGACQRHVRSDLIGFNWLNVDTEIMFRPCSDTFLTVQIPTFLYIFPEMFFTTCLYAFFLLLYTTNFS